MQNGFEGALARVFALSICEAACDAEPPSRLPKWARTQTLGAARQSAPHAQSGPVFISSSASQVAGEKMGSPSVRRIPGDPKRIPMRSSLIVGEEGPTSSARNPYHRKRMIMTKVPTKAERVQRFIAKRARNKQKGWDYKDAPDLRQQRKVEHAKESILWALELGLVSNQPTLRDVEELTENLSRWMRTFVPEGISDSTLDTESRRLDPAYLLDKLKLRVRDLHRSKMLAPVGLPCGIATVDGKNLATLNHDAEGTGHARSSDNAKWHRKKTKAKEPKVENTKEPKLKGEDYYFLMPALRATLSSCEAKVCIDQMALPPGVGESTQFPAMVDALDASYGRSGMIDVIDCDAGLTSLANATHVNTKGYGYIFGLKGNQAELFAEAQALLRPLAETQPPEAETPWERRNGKRICRRLWRTHEMAGIENSVGKWSHLRQTWLVRQIAQWPDGLIEVEDRYFLSSLLWSYLTPKQILITIRNHWAVENDTFNSLDLQWREDSGPWCTHGSAIWGLGILRLMAYNTAQILRRRRLRKKSADGTWRTPMSWRSLFKIIESALKLDATSACLG